jgi:hypothetical protein
MDIVNLFTQVGYVMISHNCARIAARLAAAALFVPGAALQAQRPIVPNLKHASYLGIGYVASVPEAFAGGALLLLTPKVLGGAGLYADVKFSPSSPARAFEYDPTITVDQADNQFADQLYLEQSAWLTVDLAFVYAVTPELGLYAGGGYSREHHYRQYFDATETRGLAGFYWIGDPAASGDRINALGGVLLRVGRYLAFQMGVGARPPGADVGVMLTLPM